MKIQFDLEKIQRYNQSGPRYTSYPTAVAFTPDFTQAQHKSHALDSNLPENTKPLSLYFHIPFCDTVCFYCACNKIATKDYSKAEAYLEYLYKEMKMQSELLDHSRKVEQLHWGGGTPTFLNHQQIRGLMAKTREYFNLLDDDSGDYSIEIDPRSVSKETIQVLRDVGFNRFSLGVQDVDDAVQKAVNRIQPIEETQAIIDACRENAAQSISVDLIYGLPLQTVEGFAKTLQTIIAISPDRISLFNYAHLPTLFKPQRRINEADLPGSQEKLDILQQSIAALVAANYDYIGMDHFAKPDDELSIAQREGKLHRSFQGYTTHSDCDLVAMGVSAISNINNSYSQNAKDLDAYYAGLDNNDLPIIRGYRLNEDDLIRREIIQQLSCQFELDFKPVEDKFGIQIKEYFASELEQLALMGGDDLLALQEDSIQITPKGRLLIRNICMVFDAYLKTQQSNQRFSKTI
ncbi:MAG: Coproporphyrinogen III oxidase, oxygen-independent (EC [uncultured Thiotrichaceae bacterium]|uniref:Coproporphyrinogen-III oxidase n=1 Tax=uncultured Thiotrichaceae bacterium TaxID=298394 RepID=A0A6S6T750_9GAMM|nr:MAG: Coproporphyrinogen III oxidase, oxygen-independent (EC [uncultured Thiotrichaceae bacterium]